MPPVLPPSFPHRLTLFFSLASASNIIYINPMEIKNEITAVKNVNNEWKLIHVRPMAATRAKRVMRIFNLADSRIPEEVLEEKILGSGIFHNMAQRVRFILRNNQLIQI